MKKHILLLSVLYSPFTGGAETAARAIARGISPDYPVRVYTARMRRFLPARETIDGISVHRLGLGLPSDRFLFPLFAFIRSFSDRFDCAYAVMESYAGMAALLINRFRGIPYILSLQSGTMDTVERSFLFAVIRPAYRAMHRRAAFIQATSPVLVSRAIRLGASPFHTRLIPNGFDPSIFNAHNPVSRSAYLIACVARLEDVKGADILIHALPRILNAFPGTECVIAGDGSRRTRYESLAADLGVSSALVFVGTCTPSKVAALFSRASVAVSPSRAEGFGIAVIEAMACGAVPVVSRVGGLPALVSPGISGIVVPPEDPESLADAIITLFRNPHSLLAMRERSIRASLPYRLDAVIPSVISLVESVRSPSARECAAEHMRKFPW